MGPGLPRQGHKEGVWGRKSPCIIKIIFFSHRVLGGVLGGDIPPLKINNIFFTQNKG